MKELQTVALGLIVVFVDVGDPDWVADPLGWLLILVGIAALKEKLPDYGYLQLTAWVCLALAVVTWPPDSVPTLDTALGWIFSLPTLAFCYLLADSLYDVTVPNLAAWFRLICWSYAVVAFLPLLPLVAGWDWLETPATFLAIGLNAIFVITLFTAAGDDAVPEESGKDKPQGSGSEKSSSSTTSSAEAKKTGTKKNGSGTRRKA